MRDYKKHIWKALTVLGVFMFIGIPHTQAMGPIALMVWGVISVGGLVGTLLGGKAFLTGIAGDVIQGIAMLINFVVAILGNVLFWIANATIDFAVKLNDLIGIGVVQEGFDISLSVANLGLLVGFIVMAIAIMIRADWLVEVRKAIPKFIVAALLINFGFFITTELLIKPVNGIFKNIYQAAKLNMETFNGVFQPNFDLTSVVGGQIELAKMGEENRDFAEKYLNYIRFKEERLGPGIDALLKQYETGGQLSSVLEDFYNRADSSNRFVWYELFGAQHFGGVAPIGYETVSLEFSVAEAPIFVTPTQRAFIKNQILYELNIFLEDMNDGANNLDQFIAGWGRGNRNIDMYFDDRGAPYKVCPDSSCTNDLKKLQQNIANFINYELSKEYSSVPKDSEPDNGLWGFGCKLWNGNEAVYTSDAVDCGEHGDDNKDYTNLSLSNIGYLAENGTGDIEKAIIMLMQTLFNAIFVFLGVFTLLGVALMFVYRYVVLSFLIILFPFVWLGWIFPKITSATGGKNIWTTWWGQFLRWLLFGPIAMFFVFLSAKAAVNMDALTQTPGAEFIGKGSMAVMAASFGSMAVVIGLLIGGMKVANTMGIAGSGMMMGAIKSSGKWLTKRAKEYAGRGLGRAGNAAANTKAGKATLSGLRKVPVLRAGAKRIDRAQERVQKETIDRLAKGLPDDPDKLAEYAKSARKSSPEYLAAVKKLHGQGKLGLLGDSAAEFFGTDEGKELAEKYGQKELYGKGQKELRTNKEIYEAGKKYEAAKKESDRLPGIRREIADAYQRGDRSTGIRLTRETVDIMRQLQAAKGAVVTAVQNFEKNEARGSKLDPSVVKNYSKGKSPSPSEAYHEIHRQAVVDTLFQTRGAGALTDVMSKISSEEASRIVDGFRSSLHGLESSLRSQHGVSGPVYYRSQADLENIIRRSGASDPDGLRASLVDLNAKLRSVNSMHHALYYGGGSPPTITPGTPGTPPGLPPTP
jgi:hypothetical protein